METITKETEVNVQDNVAEAISWLEAEYPNGIELVYVDYRDSYDENTEALQDLLKGQNDDIVDNDYDEWETINTINREYMEANNIHELSDEVEEEMREWLYEHDTSNPTKDLLKNTSRQLFYIETRDYSEDDKSNAKQLERKYGKTEAQKKEVRTTLNEQFYESPVSFYFYADVLDVWEALHGNKESKYIIVENAYFSTIDRGQGSNWLGENAIFTLSIPRQDFIDNIYLDSAKGTGYGWGEIAGQVDYDEAEVMKSDTRKKGTILVQSETSEKQQREKRLAENWEKTGKCIAGDMTYKRHNSTEYINDYPCGNKCKDCGTFWID